MSDLINGISLKLFVIFSLVLADKFYKFRNYIKCIIKHTQNFKSLKNLLKKIFILKKKVNLTNK